MATDTQPPAQSELARLAEGTLRDVETLIRQHFDLLKSELKQELTKARDAAVGIGAGAGAVAVGGALGTLMAVHLLHRVSRLPLWACYGAVGGSLGLLGAGLLSAGVRRAADMNLVPRQTAAVLKEELTPAR
jgi:Putative Actinobacterial Holin-X, holin superfamily III